MCSFFSFTNHQANSGGKPTLWVIASRYNGFALTRLTYDFCSRLLFGVFRRQLLGRNMLASTLMPVCLTASIWKEYLSSNATIMVNVAIAGSSGLAQFIANYLSTKTCHQFIILSRFPNPGLVSRGWQVLEVDYYNNSKLRYMLTGVDVVISTISGPAEASLITAAAQVNVRRFIPSEFEGPPSKRTISKLPDRGNCQSLSLLQQYEMEYTIFTCGVFYERLAPGGMAAFQLGKGTYIDKEGEYLINIPSMETEVPHLSDGQDSMICMTSAQDVARAVVAALDLPRWPREFRMFGDRMSLTGLVGTVESVFGGSFR
uniref:Uncharacterized protein n=1 Tax=Coccidioides posadasii RMSCC 3488 TaxID=454284 RepID=A0A0J6FCX7_COCPO|nr:hypothetical protein CPAG_03072 [Coccidioides posadasii RMSCC 3488]